MSWAPGEAQISHGKKIGYADTAIAAPTQIFGNFDIDLPDGELSGSEITNDDSPDYHDEIIPGTYKSGKASFKYRYTKSQFATVDGLYLLGTVTATRANAVKFFTVTGPDGSTWKFKGFISKHSLPMGEGDSPLDVEGEITVSGKVTYAAAA